MHEYRIFSGGNANTRKHFECEVPAPTAREVIRVRAASLNYSDLIIKGGDHPISRGNPPITGTDGAGVPPWTACSRQRVSRNPQRLDPSKRI
jgi:NADPH:quinone reductase-like Zn-dependent oxidoreductase